MKRLQAPLIAAALLFTGMTVLRAPLAELARKPDRITVGNFSSGKVGQYLPTGWERLTFAKIPDHTFYESVKDNDTVVVRARSQSSASGLVRKIEIDPREYPVLEWRWKVAGVLEKGDARYKEGDDYAARIYISFAHDPSRLSFTERIKHSAAKLLHGEYPPTAVLNYIWGNKAPVGTLIPSPYTARSMMLVVQSGDRLARQWIDEKRNIRSDFRRAFKSEPPMITGVAIMTDSDNTGGSATGWYGDIVFRWE